MPVVKLQSGEDGEILVIGSFSSLEEACEAAREYRSQTGMWWENVGNYKWIRDGVVIWIVK